jgi:transposase
VSMTNPSDRIEVITSVQRRRRWAASEKVRMVEETLEPGATAGVLKNRDPVAGHLSPAWRVAPPSDEPMEGA